MSSLGFVEQKGEEIPGEKNSVSHAQRGEGTGSPGGAEMRCMGPAQKGCSRNVDWG